MKIGISTEMDAVEKALERAEQLHGLNTADLRNKIGGLERTRRKGRR